MHTAATTTAPRPRRVAHALLLCMLLPVLGGCLTPGAEPAGPCDAGHILTAGLDHLDTIGADTGGFPYSPGGTPDARTTSWVLIAAALTRRAGYEGHLDPTPHLTWLRVHLDQLDREGTPTDSAANNLSLARAAFQTWGKDPAGIPINDTTTLAQAWEAHHDHDTGRYGLRLNEHLFGTFASILFEPPGAHHDQMARWIGDGTHNPFLQDEGHNTYTYDTWFIAYARLGLGPDPDNTTLSTALDDALATRIGPTGGVRGLATSASPDASSTAAALMPLSLIEPDAHQAERDAAVDYLCSQQAPGGHIRFSQERDFATTKTTAEVLIALALHEAPIPLEG